MGLFFAFTIGNVALLAKYMKDVPENEVAPK